MSRNTIEELPFVVEEWSDGFKELQGTLARAIAADIAIAAFEEAVKASLHASRTPGRRSRLSLRWDSATRTPYDAVFADAGGGGIGHCRDAFARQLRLFLAERVFYRRQQAAATASETCGDRRREGRSQ
jgi:hypothetical protein